MVLKKNDFVEVQFTAKIKNGEIFDSNIKEDLKKANLNIEPKPAIFSLGSGMFLKGVDDFLLGKELGKYEIELSPENAFGFRDSKLIQLIPMRIFKEQNLRPVPGFVFNFDGRMAKILSVSGGRIIADFNNPIAGKTVIYNVDITRKIEDVGEKAKAFMDFLFRRDLNFKIDGDKIVVETEKNMVKFVELFKDKFKEILNLDLEVVEAKEEKTGKKEEKKEVVEKEKKEKEKPPVSS